MYAGAYAIVSASNVCNEYTNQIKISKRQKFHLMVFIIMLLTYMQFCQNIREFKKNLQYLCTNRLQIDIIEVVLKKASYKLLK